MSTNTNLTFYPLLNYAEKTNVILIYYFPGQCFTTGLPILDVLCVFFWAYENSFSKCVALLSGIMSHHNLSVYLGLVGRQLQAAGSSFWAF